MKWWNISLAQGCQGHEAEISKTKTWIYEIWRNVIKRAWLQTVYQGVNKTPGYADQQVGGERCKNDLYGDLLFVEYFVKQGDGHKTEKDNAGYQITSFDQSHVGVITEKPVQNEIGQCQNKRNPKQQSLP